jgi:hypothetical protein
MGSLPQLLANGMYVRVYPSTCLHKMPQLTLRPIHGSGGVPAKASPLHGQPTLGHETNTAVWSSRMTTKRPDGGSPRSRTRARRSCVGSSSGGSRSVGDWWRESWEEAVSFRMCSTSSGLLSTAQSSPFLSSLSSPLHTAEAETACLYAIIGLARYLVTLIALSFSTSWASVLLTSKPPMQR